MVESAETYEYDKRGNLTHVYQKGKLVNQYYFGALNRLEGAMNHPTGIGATYQYNGLGNRIGKTEGKPIEPVVPTEVLSNLNLNPTRQVEDVIDLTREYHNLLQRTENDITTEFTWDKNVLSAAEGDRNYHYLQDELGNPIRFLDHLGREREVYGYDEFGQKTFNFKSEDKHLSFSNPHRVLQPFGFTGYQQDSVANTMFAQAREYQPEVGRFVGEDIIKGNGAYPFTLNGYGYCWNQPVNLVDLNGKSPLSAVGPGNSKISEEEALEIIRNGGLVHPSHLEGVSQDKIDNAWNYAHGPKYVAPEKKDPIATSSSEIEGAIISQSIDVLNGGMESIAGISLGLSKPIACAGIVIDTIGGINKNIKEGSSFGRTASDAVGDVVVSTNVVLISSGALAATIAYFTAAGSVAPGVGNAIGFVIGVLVAGVLYILTDDIKDENGKSFRDNIKDTQYNMIIGGGIVGPIWGLGINAIVGEECY